MPQQYVRQVRQESKGWRDEGISRRHRQWGYDCPAVDVDFLLIEYSAGAPVALVEYKSEGTTCNPKHPSVRAVSNLASKAGVPFFLVFYKRDYTAYEAHPINTLAYKELPRPTEFSEREYVAFLYQLRGKALPASVAHGLTDQEYCEVAVEMHDDDQRQRIKALEARCAGLERRIEVLEQENEELHLMQRGGHGTAA